MGVATYVLGVDMQHAVMFDWNPTTCGAAKRRRWLPLRALPVTARQDGLATPLPD